MVNIEPIKIDSKSKHPRAALSVLAYDTVYQKPRIQAEGCLYQGLIVSGLLSDTERLAGVSSCLSTTSRNNVLTHIIQMRHLGLGQ